MNTTARRFTRFRARAILGGPWSPSRRFAGLSGDYNVLHTDAEHMKSSIFGERIAHGLLGLCIQHGLVPRSMPVSFEERLVGIKWKFRGPIRIGDTLHVLTKIASKQDSDKQGWGRVTMDRQVVNQLGAVVQEGETEHLVARRSPPAPE